MPPRVKGDEEWLRKALQNAQRTEAIGTSIPSRLSRQRERFHEGVEHPRYEGWPPDRWLNALIALALLVIGLVALALILMFDRPSARPCVPTGPLVCGSSAAPRVLTPKALLPERSRGAAPPPSAPRASEPRREAQRYGADSPPQPAATPRLPAEPGAVSSPPPSPQPPATVYLTWTIVGGTLGEAGVPVHDYVEEGQRQIIVVRNLGPGSYRVVIPGIADFPVYAGSGQAIDTEAWWEEASPPRPGQYPIELERIGWLGLLGPAEQVGTLTVFAPGQVPPVRPTASPEAPAVHRYFCALEQIPAGERGC